MTLKAKADSKNIRVLHLITVFSRFDSQKPASLFTITAPVSRDTKLSLQGQRLTTNGGTQIKWGLCSFIIGLFLSLFSIANMFHYLAIKLFQNVFAYFCWNEHNTPCNLKFFSPKFSLNSWEPLLSCYWNEYFFILRISARTSLVMKIWF